MIHVMIDAHYNLVTFTHVTIGLLLALFRQKYVMWYRLGLGLG